jgi:hypothetical protein
MHLSINVDLHSSVVDFPLSDEIQLQPLKWERKNRQRMNHGRFLKIEEASPNRDQYFWLRL